MVDGLADVLPYDGLGIYEIELQIQEIEAEQHRRKFKEAQGAYAAVAKRRYLRDFPGHSMLGWVELTHPGYLAGWFHLRLCAEMERFQRQIEMRKSPHLMVFAPPRHGKTAIISERAPVKMLAHNPEWDGICASYGQSLANINSRAARAIARSHEAALAFPRLKADKTGRHASVDTVDRWTLPGGGVYQARGVGAGIAGHGGRFLIIDDAIRSAADARSQAARDSTFEWYRRDAYTRVAPGGGVCIMNTRWHHDDLPGRLLAAEGTIEEGGRWRVVRFPAIAQEDEPYRKAGEALDANRWPLERLLQLKKTLGQQAWEALFQQNPTKQEGEKVKRHWLRERYKASPETLAQSASQIWVSVDSAKKAKKSSDFHSILVFAIREGRYFLLDRVCEKLEYPDFERKLDEVWAKWGGWVRMKPGGLLIEDTANGTTYIQSRRKQNPYIVEFLPNRDTPGADKSKEARANWTVRIAEGGGLILPDQSIAPWVGDYVDTLVAFPHGLNDDDMDSTSQLMVWNETKNVLLPEVSSPW